LVPQHYVATTTSAIQPPTADCSRERPLSRRIWSTSSYPHYRLAADQIGTHPGFEAQIKRSEGHNGKSIASLSVVSIEPPIDTCTKCPSPHKEVATRSNPVWFWPPQELTRRDCATNRLGRAMLPRKTILRIHLLRHDGFSTRIVSKLPAVGKRFQGGMPSWHNAVFAGGYPHLGSLYVRLSKSRAGSWADASSGRPPSASLLFVDRAWYVHPPYHHTTTPPGVPTMTKLSSEIHYRYQQGRGCEAQSLCGSKVPASRCRARP